MCTLDRCTPQTLRCNLSARWSRHTDLCVDQQDMGVHYMLLNTTRSRFKHSMVAKMGVVTGVQGTDLTAACNDTHQAIDVRDADPGDLSVRC